MGSQDAGALRPGIVKSFGATRALRGVDFVLFVRERSTLFSGATVPESPR